MREEQGILGMRKNTTLPVFIQACLCIFLSLLFSCSSSSGGSSDNKSGNGSIAFSVQVAPEELFGSSYTKAASGDSGSVRSEAAIDCGGLGIVSVEAYVYDENEELIARGGPWDCSAGEGIIYGVKEGPNRTVLIFMKNGNDQVRYSGQSSALTIVAGQTTDAGVIEVVEAEDENRLPIASNDHATVHRGGCVTILDSGLASLLGNDIDPDGRTLTASTSPVTGPSHGMLTLNPDGTFRYQHDGSDSMSDSFTYRVSDPGGETATAVVSVTVTPGPNAIPRLSEGGVSPEIGDETRTYTYSVRYEDPDGNAPEHVRVHIDGVDHEMALSSGSASEGIYQYKTTLAEKEQPYAYSFSAGDGHSGSAVFPESGSLTGPTVLKNPYLIAFDDEIRVYKGGVVTVLQSGFTSVLSNDSAPSILKLTVNTEVEPDQGELTLLPGGTFAYRHNGITSEADSFVYRVSDGIGGWDTATVRITVIDSDVNHNPVLSEGSVSPRMGDTTTLFTYSVHYFDEDGHKPVEISVSVDGTSRAMRLTEGLPHNGIYRYSTTLSAGSHTCFFACNDGYGGSGRDPETEALSGPEVSGPAARFYVAPPPKGSDTGGDGSLSAPFGSIGRAIEIAHGAPGNRAVIRIAAGTYSENISLDPWETIEGGWNSDLTLRWDFRNGGITPSPEFEAVIEGIRTGRCVTINSAEGASIDGLTVRGGSSGAYTMSGISVLSCSPHIVNCRIEKNRLPGDTDSYGAGMLVTNGSPLIEHCIFSGNYANVSSNSYGGGIYNLSSSPVIIDCVFTGNYAGCTTGAGGAMYNMQSSPTILNCLFTANGTGGTYALGGAIYNNASSPIIMSSTFTNNLADGASYGQGGAVYNVQSSPTILNCLFTANSAGGTYALGGAIFNSANSPVIMNSIFTKNLADGTSYGKGGAMYNQSGSPAITNCSFTLNTAYSESTYAKAGGIYNESPAAPAITNCILWDNSATYYKELYYGSSCSITYSDIDQAEFAADSSRSNFRLDPLFADPAGSDVRLMPGSPCIDKGSGSTAYLPETDYAGIPRILGTSVDMGAFEWWLLQE